MEGVPVGVIVGLFSAISHQLPAFSEWDTQKHHHLLHSNEAICEAMTEVREHVTYYGTSVLACYCYIGLLFPCHLSDGRKMCMRESDADCTTTEPYLRSRSEAAFDRSDFDCLSNKFLSKLVIRAN